MKYIYTHTYKPNKVSSSDIRCTGMNLINNNNYIKNGTRNTNKENKLKNRRQTRNGVKPKKMIVKIESNIYRFQPPE